MKNIMLSDEMVLLLLDFCKKNGIPPSLVVTKSFDLLKVMHEKDDGYEMALVKLNDNNEIEQFKIVK